MGRRPHQPQAHKQPPKSLSQPHRDILPSSSSATALVSSQYYSLPPPPSQAQSKSRTCFGWFVGWLVGWRTIACWEDSVNGCCWRLSNYSIGQGPHPGTLCLLPRYCDITSLHSHMIPGRCKIPPPPTTTTVQSNPGCSAVGK